MPPEHGDIVERSVCFTSVLFHSHTFLFVQYLSAGLTLPTNLRYSNRLCFRVLVALKGQIGSPLYLRIRVVSYV